MPFSHDELLAVFARYNSFWPILLLVYPLALFAFGALVVRARLRARWILLFLACLWAWTGIAYHLFYFSDINPAAYAFGTLFLTMSAQLVAAALQPGDPTFRRVGGIREAVAWFLLAYAMFFYPFIGVFLGQPWNALPMFGITPCPLTLFTLGFLLLLEGRAPWALLAVPLLWSLIGGSAAVLLAMPQDWLLLVSGPLVLWLRIRDRAT